MTKKQEQNIKTIAAILFLCWIVGMLQDVYCK